MFACVITIFEDTWDIVFLLSVPAVLVLLKRSNHLCNTQSYRGTPSLVWLVYVKGIPCYFFTDRPTDRQTDSGTYRVNLSTGQFTILKIYIV